MSMTDATPRTLSCTATFVNGSFKPDQPVELEDQTRVEITLRSLPQDHTAKAGQPSQLHGAVEALKELKRTHPINSGGIKFSREELYERD